METKLLMLKGGTEICGSGSNSKVRYTSVWPPLLVPSVILLKMELLSILAYLSTYFQALFWTTHWASKPKPVDLEYKCMDVFDPNNDFKHDDVPVILLHGLGVDKENWNGVFEAIALGTKKKVCVADLRNHGQSPWNDEEYDTVAMTEDVKHLIDRIKAPKAIVLGHSLGGKVAVHLALNYPEKVEKIIVEDMRPNGMTLEAVKEVQFLISMLKEAEKHLPQGITEKDAEEKVLEFFKECFEKMNIHIQLDNLNLKLVKCSNGKCQLRTNPVILDAAIGNIIEVLNESSGRFDGSALFVYGTESTFKVKEDESNIKKLFPNAKLVPVEGADHRVHPSKKFTREIIEFINSK